MMVTLQFYKPADYSALNYVLNDVQMRHTSTVDFALNRTEKRVEKEIFTDYPITIFYNEEAVGFFILDFGKDKFELIENENSILIRSLSINPKFQGKGIGKSAMFLVTEFIQNNFPNVNEIVLTVNVKNDVAHQIYVEVGFQFEGKTKEGRSGLQYILSKKFK